MTNERQAAEKDLQLRSRLTKILNVPKRGYASGFNSPAALLDVFLSSLWSTMETSP